MPPSPRSIACTSLSFSGLVTIFWTSRFESHCIVSLGTSTAKWKKSPPPPSWCLPSSKYVRLEYRKSGADRCRFFGYRPSVSLACPRNVFVHAVICVIGFSTTAGQPSHTPGGGAEAAMVAFACCRSWR